jgi:hypothetical protein
MRATLAGLLLAAGLAHAAPPVAFVADIRGNATIEGDGRLNFLAELGPGTRLLLGSGASASISYAATGAEFTIGGPGEFLVAPAEVKAEKGKPPKKRMAASPPDPAVVSQVSKSATASLRMRSLAPAAAPAPPEPRLADLPADARARAEKSRAAARTFTDRLNHAMLLQQLGAGHESRQAWADLARERPDLPELAALAR